MRISFDLDETLILSDPNRPYENIPWYARLFCRERLRRGTIALARELEQMGFRICIYTTSFRSPRYINRLFRRHGIKLDLIVNAAIHEQIVRQNRSTIMPSKVPSKFGITLHVDDEISVRDNGVQHGFEVLLIDSKDPEWTKKVVDRARILSQRKRN